VDVILEVAADPPGRGAMRSLQDAREVEEST
jgi:hypothetical protein